MAGKTIHSKTGVRKLAKEYQAAHPRTRELIFVLQDWSDGYNVGGLFRVADAVGATAVILTGKTPDPSHPMVPVTSLGAHRRVHFERCESNEEAVRKLKEQGFHAVAVEIAEGAVSYLEFEWPEKVALVLGNEQKGVYGKVMKEIDAAVFIPMSGKGRSLNVHVAAAVVGFHVMLGQ